MLFRDQLINFLDSMEAEPAIVNVEHLLCVSTQQPPQEKHHEPQWFSVAHAKRALVEGRDLKYQQGFCRVVDAALERLWH